MPDDPQEEFNIELANPKQQRLFFLLFRKYELKRQLREVNAAIDQMEKIIRGEE